jgi:hypothetical protein
MDHVRIDNLMIEHYVRDTILSCGDADADEVLSIGDALLVAQCDAGFGLPSCTTPDYLYAADANADGNRNILDAMLIAQHVAGLPVLLQCPPEYP